MDIIEYLKVLVSIQVPQNEMDRRNALLDAMGPYYENYTGTVPYDKPQQDGGLKKSDFCSAVVQANAAKPSVPVTLSK
jgi:hypothetical protein